MRQSEGLPGRSGGLLIGNLEFSERKRKGLAYPKDLAGHVHARWDNLVAGSYKAPPCPPKSLLTKLLDTIYISSRISDEGRYPSFRLIAFPESQSSVLESQFEVFRFSEARPLTVSELTRLAPATDVKKSAILTEWRGHQWAIAGLVDLGSDWTYARSGFSYNYLAVPSLLVEVDSQARLSVYQGDYLVASLANGILEEFDIKIELSLYGPAKDGLSVIGPLLTPPELASMRDFHEFAHMAYLNVLISIANSIVDYGHGGAIIIIPPNSTISADCRFKYEMKSRALQKYFITFMNSRTRLFDAMEVNIQNNHSFDDKIGSLKSELNEAQKELSESIRFIARLCACDGAIVISSDLTLHGFGCEIRSDIQPGTQILLANSSLASTGSPLDLEIFGLRHRSAVKLVSKSPSYVEIVVSQDGPISLIWSKDGTVIVRRGARLVNNNMPWA